MVEPAARSLAEEIAAAHDAARLRSAATLVVRFSSGGLAFAAQGQPDALRLVDARLSPTEQRIP